MDIVEGTLFQPDFDNGERANPTAAKRHDGMTPRESMPELVQHIVLFAPTVHFIELASAFYFGALLRNRKAQ